MPTYSLGRRPLRPNVQQLMSGSVHEYGPMILLVVGVLILLIVIGVVVRSGRKRKVAAGQAKAEELRREADRARLDASEHAANAVTADASAQQARVEAEKLRLEADARADDASAAAERAREHDQRADELDPDRPNRPDGALDKSPRRDGTEPVADQQQS